MDSTPSRPILDLFSLKGQNALITGASRGIGAACALALAQAGADLCLILRPPVDPQLTPEIVNTIRTACPNARVEVVHADLSDTASVKRVFPLALEKMNGEIDIFVNCAGIQRRAPAELFSEDDWDEFFPTLALRWRVLTTNLKSAFLLSQAAGAHMLSRPANPPHAADSNSNAPTGSKTSVKSIIHFASLLSFQGGLTVPAYAAAKGGIAQLVKALSNEWSGKGVRVNAVVPGYVRTDMNSALLANPTRLRQISERIPAGRWGDPADFAGVVVFLASRASLYVCGELVVVDGGWMGR
ncbi:hypothetical protein GALMADRAFT_1173407 [Galerina marginata CBS 339.88]|uniref:Ketoreductase (KR) domain-containing protein n=1 Tax=Galerina marginata (strain CBS 339.88) TaxID=685588 RepID=A0A067TM25_GALM3|nr:hypothetical protein GALMADRAFT_1173407 [Galerina marginata CBS 339.88]